MRTSVQVLDRAVRILRVIARAGPISLTSISQELRLPVPTTARILKSLEENGVVQRLEGRQYHLGARLLPLAQRVDLLRDSLPVVHRVVNELSRLTGEDVGFAVLQGNEAVIVDWSYGSREPHTIEPYSREIPLHCAFGMVLIAFQSAKWRENFLEAGRFRGPEQGHLVDKAVLGEKIEAIRRRGLYFSEGENVEGAGSLSVPVFNHLSRLVGALFVTGPLERLHTRDTAADTALLFANAEGLRKALCSPRARREFSATSKG